MCFLYPKWWQHRELSIIHARFELPILLSREQEVDQSVADKAVEARSSIEVGLRPLRELIAEPEESTEIAKRALDRESGDQNLDVTAFQSFV